MRYKSTDWSLDVPEGWSAESGEDSTAFTHAQGVGALQISSYRKDQAVTDDDLREFTGELPLASVSFGKLAGFRARLSEDGMFWTLWWLRAGRQMLHVTYNCSLADRGREDTDVDAMIESIIPEYESAAA